MSWQDRDYSRPSPKGGGGASFDLMNGSLSLGNWFGINVRVHMMLVLWIGFKILLEGGRSGMGAVLMESALLFGIILLHEFGHCFAARKVGGHADQILMWPLGGLAFTRVPQRPWPNFATYAGGPLVNVVICVISALILNGASQGAVSLPWNPFLIFGGLSMNESTWIYLMDHPAQNFLYWTFATSWALLAFNLLPCFPLDGGGLLQAVLWWKMGYYRSMTLACQLGIGGAVLFGMFSLTSGNLFGVVLAVTGFMACRATLANLPDLAQMAYEANDRYTASPAKSKPKRPMDDKFTWRDLSPFERIARARRKKKFARLFEDD